MRPDDAPSIDPQPHPLRATALPALLCGVLLSLAAFTAGLRSARMFDQAFFGDETGIQHAAYLAYLFVPPLVTAAMSIVSLAYWRAVRGAFVPEIHDGPKLRRSLVVFWVATVLTKIAVLALDTLGAIAWPG